MDPEVDLLSDGDSAQLTFESQTTLVWLLESYNKHFPREPLMYFSIRRIAFQWCSHGEIRNWLTALTAKEISGH